MNTLSRLRAAVGAIALATLAASCTDSREPTAPGNNGNNNGNGTGGPGTDSSSTPGTGTTGATLNAIGLGAITARFTAEVWVRGNTAYTTTWGSRGANRGNTIYIWDVSANAAPTLVDSVSVANAGTLGDIQTSDDGKLLIAAIEPSGSGGIAVFDISTNARRPVLQARTTFAPLTDGVHTAEVARVDGTVYVFCAVNSGRLAIVSLANPASPQVVTTINIGGTIHDTHVRNGILFNAEWSNGVAIYDIGGGGMGGSPASPRLISRIRTVGGNVHNMWWFHDPTISAVPGNKRYLFVGEEGPGTVGSVSSGDVHVVDISDMSQPREVAYYNLLGAGTHNFSMDEANGILYAAYYNGGVRALDVRGDLSACNATQRATDGRCRLHAMSREKAAFTGTGSPLYVWGVHYQNGSLYASDMLNGLWKLQSVAR